MSPDTREPDDDDQPLCNLLYAALAIEGGATVVDLQERDRYPQIRLGIETFDRERLARELEALAATVRRLPARPRHVDLVKAFTNSFIRRADVQVRAWKRAVSDKRRHEAAAAVRAVILARPDAVAE